jgi:hypothetical protein
MSSLPPSPNHESRRSHPDRHEALNALSAIIGTAQLLRRSARGGRALELERRVDRIERSARQVAAYLASDEWQDDAEQ